MSSLASAESIVSRLTILSARGHGLLLASDVDGTLAPIAEDRHASRVDEAAIAALHTLSQREAITLCIVSGRPLADLRVLLAGVPRCILIAEHGTITVFPDGREEREAPSETDALAMARLQPEVDRFLAEIPGSLLERKETAVALHIRGVSAPWAKRASAVLREVSDAAVAGGLEALFGRAILEIRPPRMSGKAQALTRMLGKLAAGTPVAFAGDDLSDDPALVLAAQNGLGVFIVSDERPHPPALPGVLRAERATWVEALARFARSVPL